MSELSSFADYLADWDLLLKGVTNKGSALPDLTGLVAPVEGVLDEGRDLEADKAAARAQLSQAAKRSRALIVEGRAAASRLRSLSVSPLQSYRRPAPKSGTTSSASSSRM